MKSTKIRAVLFKHMQTGLNLTLKLVSTKKLSSLAKHYQNKSLALASGCFDILHPGHIYFLNQASKHADVLIVGVNSDRSIKNLKERDRPIIPEGERCKTLSALAMIDHIFIFNEPDITKYISILKPNVYVVFSESITPDKPEIRACKKTGTKIVIVNRYSSNSTTTILQRLKKEF